MAFWHSSAISSFDLIFILCTLKHDYSKNILFTWCLRQGVETSCSVNKRFKIADIRIFIYIFNAVNASSPFSYRFGYCTEYFIHNQRTQNLQENKNLNFEYKRILRITNNKLNWYVSVETSKDIHACVGNRTKWNTIMKF